MMGDGDSRIQGVAEKGGVFCGVPWAVQSISSNLDSSSVQVRPNNTLPTPVLTASVTQQ